ncbi:MAG: hypothetical protein H6907_20265 [Hyphomicrobiales bacterium]|nr:hypothetical protein [Hyphomicrobiales bacterium]MCP5374076.1 hypothetical protein [Hyphomicrobiales bacterium]
MKIARYFLFAWLGLSVPGGALAEFDPPAPQPPPASPPQGRSWDLSVRASAGHDNNPVLATDVTFYTGHRDSNYYSAQIMGEWRFWQTMDWTAGVTGNVDVVRYTENKDPGQVNAPDEYNLNAIDLGAYLRHHFKVMERPASVGAAYGFTSESWRTHLGSLVTNEVTVDVAASPFQNVEVGASVDVAFNNYEVRFPAPMLNDRDSRSTRLGGFLRYWFRPGLTSLTLNAAYTNTDAQGSNFDYEGNSVGARLESQIFGPVWGAIEYSEDWRDYENGFVAAFIPSPGRTSMDIITVSMRVLWVIGPNLIADLYFTETEYDGNMPQFDTVREQYGIGLTYRF